MNFRIESTKLKFLTLLTHSVIMSKFSSRGKGVTYMSEGYPWESTGEMVEDRAKEIPNRVYLYYYDETYTFADFNKWTNKVAYALKKLGFGKDDKIAVYLVNSPQMLFSFYGAHKIGATAVPVNVEWKEDEVLYVLNHCDAKGLVVGSNLIQIVRNIREDAKRLEKVIVVDEESLGTGEPKRADVKGDEIDWYELVEPQSDERDFSLEADLDSIAYIYYTAGTTGRPKGVPLLHRNVMSYYKERKEQETGATLFAGRPMIMAQPLTFMVILPLYHVNAMMSCTMGLVGGLNIVLRKKFSAREFWPTIERYKVNAFSAVPAVYHILLRRAKQDDSWKKYNRSSLFLGLTGAAEIPPETIKEVEKTFGFVVLEGYGLTEGTVMSTMNPAAERKIGSVGKPAPGQEIKIVDDHGDELPPGQIGEVTIKGENIMKGYYKDEEATRQTIKDGWLYTGDLGYMDKEGFLYLVGRKKDMIIRGGENIYPAEIERVIAEHPKVSEVAVVGVKDKVMGEEVKAYIIPKDLSLKEDELREYLKEKLAEHKVPKYIAFVDEFPRSQMGKVLKRELREKAAKEHPIE